MRTAVVCSKCSIAMVLVGLGCASTQTAGQLGEGSAPPPKITAVDTAFPRRSVTIDIPQPGYAAVLLVAPGHSATLLYPRDSVTSAPLSAGAHQLTFELPGFLMLDDSSRFRVRPDTARFGARPRTRTSRTLAPLPPTTPTYLLLITSPQPLSYQRIVEKTAGVTIPNLDTEALNAVAKTIKSTIPNEPREWAGYYQLVEFRRTR